jgi:hypothetical protein
MLVATLAGCGRSGELATRAPLLHPSDTAPKLRGGLWRFVWPNYADNPCPFDPTQPIKAWPPCNAAEWVAPNRMTDIAVVQTPLGPIRTERSHAYALASAETPVLQRYDDVYRRRYTYDAVDRVERDAAGRIVAARLTPIDCVDPAALTEAMEWQANAVTEDNTHPIDEEPTEAARLALLPGFVWDFDGECLPRDLAALSAAATAAAAASTEGVNFRWVRDGAQ